MGIAKKAYGLGNCKGGDRWWVLPHTQYPVSIFEAPVYVTSKVQRACEGGRVISDDCMMSSPVQLAIWQALCGFQVHSISSNTEKAPSEVQILRIRIDHRHSRNEGDGISHGL